MKASHQSDADELALERFDRYYLKAPNGTIRFNISGRARLAPWFAQHGFSLQSCKTEADFHAALRQIHATELETARDQLTELLKSPDISPDERAALELLLHKKRP